MIDWLGRLTKWRSVFAGWQLGTRRDDDPECQAVRDHREVTLLLRAEVSALAALLVRQGVITEHDFLAQVQAEAEHLCTQYELKFPGFKAADDEITMDVQVAAKTTKHWRP